MPPKPREKRTRVSSSEEDSQSSVLAEAAMSLIQDIQRKLEKLKVLYKISEQLSKIEYDIKGIKGNVAKLEEGLNSGLAEIKQDLEKKAEKEKLEELEKELEELRNRSRRNNFVFYNIPKKAEEKDCAEFIQDFIATHMGLETRVKYLHGIPWNSMEFQGVPWSIHGVPWNALEFCGVSMKFHGVSMEFHGMPCSSMKFHLMPWNSMEFLGVSMEFHEMLWSCMEFHGVSIKFDIHSCLSS